MKLLLSIICLSFLGCSNSSKLERSLVGTWEWKLDSGKFSEKGFVVLNKDRTHTFKFASTNLNEKIMSTQDETSGYWRVIDGWVCLASEFSIGLFSRVTVEKEVCHWKVDKSGSGQLILRFQSGLTVDNVVAYRNEA